MKDGGHSDGKCKKCGTLRRGNDTGEHVPDSVDCIRWKKSSGPVGLVSNQGSVYPVLGPFHVIASF